MFVGCDEAPSTEGAPSTEEAPSTEGGYETFTMVGETMQVAKEDFPESMNISEAMEECKGLGNGWSLPTKGQLMAMYEQLHKQGKGNFKDSFYWSSSRDYNSAYYAPHYNVNFSNGSVSDEVKESGGHQVRAVRAKP